MKPRKPCPHGPEARRPQIQIIDGKRRETSYCHECKLAYQRLRNGGLQRAFRQLATARWA